MIAVPTATMTKNGALLMWRIWVTWVTWDGV